MPFSDPRITGPKFGAVCPWKSDKQELRSIKVCTWITKMPSRSFVVLGQLVVSVFCCVVFKGTELKNQNSEGCYRSSGHLPVETNAPINTLPSPKSLVLYSLSLFLSIHSFIIHHYVISSFLFFHHFYIYDNNMIWLLYLWNGILEIFFFFR